MVGCYAGPRLGDAGEAGADEAGADEAGADEASADEAGENKVRSMSLASAAWARATSTGGVPRKPPIQLPHSTALA